MDLIRIYECLCDATRLRILNVLAQGPLCVCHFQAVLKEPQVKISKHLGYLRARGMVECVRQGNWMVYELPKKASKELRANLACLQDCAREKAAFTRDVERLQALAPAEAVAAVCEGRGCRCRETKRRSSTFAKATVDRRTAATKTAKARRPNFS